MKTTTTRSWLRTTALACLGATALNAGTFSGLEKGFVRPPDSARPWVYWFPLDGNITSNGITLDLEAISAPASPGQPKPSASLAP